MYEAAATQPALQMGVGDGKEHCPEAESSGFRVSINLGINSSVPLVSWGLGKYSSSLSLGVLVVTAEACSGN